MGCIWWEAKLDAPGGGLSVQDIDGKIDGEDRGKQDEAQKATTSAADEAIGKKNAAKSRTTNGKRKHTA